MKTTSRTLALAALTILCGCASVGPDYVAPAATSLHIPTRWAAGSASVSAFRSEAWWQGLGDDTLNALVRRAKAASPTVDAAVARLAESRASRDQVYSSATPAVTASTGAQRADPSGQPVSTSSASLNASWELDLFGAVRRGIEGAQARVQARQADLADVHVSLAADVADAYSSLRHCQTTIELTTADLASRESTARLTGLKADAGFTAPYLAARAQATAAEGQTALTSVMAQCERDVNLLVRLTGMDRAELVGLLGAGSPVPAPDNLSVALPQDALTSRPDLAMAERTLAAAAADVGLAEANRYPRLSLLGSLGYNTTDAGKGAVSLGVWSFGPTISVPLLDGGSRKAAASAAQARYDQALASYRLKALVAVQEVEDALNRYGAAVARQQTAAAAVSGYAASFEAMDARFREGAASLIELEDARRALLSARQTASAIRLEQTQAWISLHRATGGGWTASAAL